MVYFGPNFAQSTGQLKQQTLISFSFIFINCDCLSLFVTVSVTVSVTGREGNQGLMEVAAGHFGKGDSHHLAFDYQGQYND